MPRNSVLVRPFAALAFPGVYLYTKYNQYKQRQQDETTRKKVAEYELSYLNTKIVSMKKGFLTSGGVGNFKHLQDPVVRRGLEECVYQILSLYRFSFGQEA